MRRRPEVDRAAKRSAAQPRQLWSTTPDMSDPPPPIASSWSRVSSLMLGKIGRARKNVGDMNDAGAKVGIVDQHNSSVDVGLLGKSIYAVAPNVFQAAAWTEQKKSEKQHGRRMARGGAAVT
eukprot:6178575-Pleurochrysis_carterae.AAC.10